MFFISSGFTNAVTKVDKNIFVEHKSAFLQLLVFWGLLTARSFTLENNCCFLFIHIETQSVILTLGASHLRNS